MASRGTSCWRLRRDAIFDAGLANSRSQGESSSQSNSCDSSFLKPFQIVGTQGLSQFRSFSWGVAACRGQVRYILRGSDKDLIHTEIARMWH